MESESEEPSHEPRMARSHKLAEGSGGSLRAI